LGCPPPSQHHNYQRLLHTQQRNRSECPDSARFPAGAAQITRRRDRSPLLSICSKRVFFKVPFDASSVASKPDPPGSSSTRTRASNRDLAVDDSATGSRLPRDCPARPRSGSDPARSIMPLYYNVSRSGLRLCGSASSPWNRKRTKIRPISSAHRSLLARVTP